MEGVVDVDEAREIEPRAVFDDFYRAHLRPVVALAYGLSGSRSASEELAQEAFLAAYRRWGEISAYDDPGAWVRRVVINRSVSGVRRRVAEVRALTRLRNRPVPPVELPEPADAFWRAVRSLPPQQARVVALHYADDCSVTQIASICGIAEGTVKAHLHKARNSLADRLGHTLEEDA
jgi:RNA polymerase sigma-70 factor (ECF subfamily)